MDDLSSVRLFGIPAFPHNLPASTAAAEGTDSHTAAAAAALNETLAAASTATAATVGTPSAVGVGSSTSAQTHSREHQGSAVPRGPERSSKDEKDKTTCGVSRQTTDILGTSESGQEVIGKGRGGLQERDNAPQKTQHNLETAGLPGIPVRHFREAGNLGAAGGDERCTEGENRGDVSVAAAAVGLGLPPAAMTAAASPASGGKREGLVRNQDQQLLAEETLSMKMK